MNYETSFTIGDRIIQTGGQTYFIADIGANHDGNLGRAKMLIDFASNVGADCVKFQHFKAEKIVSAVGFEGLKSAHQRGWDRSVFEVYQDYSINPDWNHELASTAKECGVHFMTTPYDIESVDEINPRVEAFKIGSGDITYHALIRAIAMMGKPTFMATGASSFQEVVDAVDNYLLLNRQLCLMQCNTNYTGSVDNFEHVNLNVLKTYAKMWPGMPLGLSDHTPGHACVLGAVALGACVIEKHFTDDSTRKGPDHGFALEPHEWNSMVLDTRKLESAMGDGIKIVEDNEVESRVVQRRALRLNDSFQPEAMIIADNLDALRPCPNGAYTPAQVEWVVGRRLARAKEAGQALYPEDFQ